MIYFDNAATSMPKSRSVKNAMCDALRNCGTSGRSGHVYSLNAAQTVYNCRKKLAKMFNTRPECVIFTSSATEALNIAIKGTNRPGGVTLVSSDIKCLLILEKPLLFWFIGIYLTRFPFSIWIVCPSVVNLPGSQQVINTCPWVI